MCFAEEYRLIEEQKKLEEEERKKKEEEELKKNEEEEQKKKEEKQCEKTEGVQAQLKDSCEKVNEAGEGESHINDNKNCCEKTTVLGDVLANVALKDEKTEKIEGNAGTELSS